MLDNISIWSWRSWVWRLYGLYKYLRCFLNMYINWLWLYNDIRTFTNIRTIVAHVSLFRCILLIIILRYIWSHLYRLHACVGWMLKWIKLFFIVIVWWTRLNLLVLHLLRRWWCTLTLLVLYVLIIVLSLRRLLLLLALEVIISYIQLLLK